VCWSRSPGELVAEHPFVAPGEVSIIDEHYGSARPDRPRRAPRARTTAEKQFLALGGAAAAFLAGAAAAGVSPLPREIDQILVLLAAHGDTAVITTLERATQFRRWRADDVRSILAAACAAPPRYRGLTSGLHAARQRDGEDSVTQDERARRWWTLLPAISGCLAQRCQRSACVISNSPAAPIPPPMHMVITVYHALRRRPSSRAWPTRRAPLMP
jgi:hypothetical protein